MTDSKDACVYNGIEYIITGRSAVKRRGNVSSTVLEIQPKHNGGFDDELNIWVSPSELYMIEDEDDE